MYIASGIISGFIRQGQNFNRPLYEWTFFIPSVVFAIYLSRVKYEAIGH